jgi:phage portal protein BeeE
MKCFVESCNKEYKNNLVINRHIKYFSSKCLEHKQYLIDLQQKIIDKFKDEKFSIKQVAKQFNVGTLYVTDVWQKSFSKEEVRVRSLRRIKLDRTIKKKAILN